jgi:hypothetical protein
MALLRWQQADGKRHALKLVDTLHPDVDESFIALCGVTVTPRRMDFHEFGGRWLDPTCTECQGAWLGTEVTATGILL